MIEYVTRISGYFLAAFFLYTGIDKVFHYGGFVKALGSYAVVPESLAPFLALPVIVSEIVVGLAFLVPSWRRSAARASALLLVGFTAALAVNLQLGVEAPCGCWFTLSLGAATGQHILLNLVLLALALSLAFESPPRREPLAPATMA